METLYTISATSVGGRDGHVKSETGRIDLDLKPPKEMGGPGGAPNPEELFAAGYAACFNGALNAVIRGKRLRTGELKVTVAVSIGKTPEGAYQLAAHITGQVPGVSLEEAKKLVEEAHQVCPYSRATRGNIEVQLDATV